MNTEISVIKCVLSSKGVVDMNRNIYQTDGKLSIALIKDRSNVNSKAY